MENATHGLKMAFCVMIFAIALSISFLQFSKVKTTMDAIMYAKDKSSYYEIKDYEQENPILRQKRVVGLETVISNIFNYGNSNYDIHLRKGSYNESNGKIINIQNIKIYTSNISEDICNFNLLEEKNRREEWTETNEAIKEHLQVLLYGGVYNGVTYQGLLNTDLSNNPRFVEEISEKEVDGNKVTSIYYTIF